MLYGLFSAAVGTVLDASKEIRTYLDSASIDPSMPKVPSLLCSTKRAPEPMLIMSKFFASRTIVAPVIFLSERNACQFSRCFDLIDQIPQLGKSKTSPERSESRSRFCQGS